MKRSIPITCLFLDIGGVLLTDGWGREHRAQAARVFGLNLTRAASNRLRGKKSKFLLSVTGVGSAQGNKRGSRLHISQMDIDTRRQFVHSEA